MDARTTVEAVTSGARRAWEAVPRGRGPAKRALSLLASLNDLGWGRSAQARMALDGEGGPLPWYTYAAIYWLGPRLRPTDRVFEYGCGSSTRWYAGRVAEVVAVEHDQGWAAKVQPLVPSTVAILARPCSGDAYRAPEGDAYVGALAEHAATPFDVVVVDGRARNSCVEAAVAVDPGTSLVVLDNADRPGYADALELLAAQGYGRIDFMGPVPGSGRLGYTSVFARDLGRWLDVHPPLPHLGYDPLEASGTATS